MYKIKIKILFVIIMFIFFTLLIIPKTLNTSVKATSTPSVKYTTYVHNKKWQPWVKDKATSGKKNKGLNLEGIKIRLYGLSNVKIKYKVYLQGTGWQGWRENGSEAGKPGKRRIEAIRIQLQDTDEYSVQYRIYLQNKGWQSWIADGGIAGKIGKRIEAIQIRIVPKIVSTKLVLETPINNIYYSSTKSLTISGYKMTNLSNTSIKAYIDDIEIENEITYSKRPDIINAICGYGTSTQNKKPGYQFDISMNKLSEGEHTLKIRLYQGEKRLKTGICTFKIDRQLHVQYRTNIASYGWQDYVLDGASSGKAGKGKRMKYLNIKMFNKPSSTSEIKYRVYSEEKWQDWVANGATASGTGKYPQIEKIQIKLNNLDEKTVEYRAYVEGKGWTSWCIDGESCRKERQENRSYSSEVSSTLPKRI